MYMVTLAEAGDTGEVYLDQWETIAINDADDISAYLKEKGLRSDGERAVFRK
jgi:hypothetical protein